VGAVLGWSHPACSFRLGLGADDGVPGLEAGGLTTQRCNLPAVGRLAELSFLPSRFMVVSTKGDGARLGSADIQLGEQNVCFVPTTDSGTNAAKHPTSYSRNDTQVLAPSRGQKNQKVQYIRNRDSRLSALWDILIEKLN
jgi:hypothetical protein